MKVFVSTVPFSQTNSLPLELMRENGIEVVINPLGRKITTEELADFIEPFDALIAGTEQIDNSVLDRARNLKLIARVGIGLDGVDLNELRARNIHCTYTPDAPAPAVAELAMAYILMLARNVGISNRQLQNGQWERHFGYRLSEMTIGIIGAGRIGSRVIRRLTGFGSPRILVNDIAENKNITTKVKLEWVGKEEIYSKSDLISLHVPLTPETHNMISSPQFAAMKENIRLINTARGGIINERDLAAALRTKKVHSAAVDVFESEPYFGELSTLDNCFLSSHMGSMSYDCRSNMEIEATREIINFLNKRPFNNVVPETEYAIQRGKG